MTFEKKCLIDPSDIVAVRYECDNCHAATSLPIAKIGSNAWAAEVTSKCAHCHTPTKLQDGTTEFNIFMQFNTFLKEIATAMQGRNLKLRLEIKCPDEIKS
ncbi:MAG TPA: hypothetical protein VFQ43_02965 [Nitrososphaera sp.]|nr:hypothetical protein [Nitrososphaera sp.]